jgi:sialic acid synthase SpsE
MNQPAREFEIGGRPLGRDHPVYFIADVAANHDGDLERARALIHLAAEAGADAAKFQHFAAATIVSDRGFRDLGGQKSHQARWRKSVYQVYEEASLDPDWTPALAETCREAGITFFTSPYSFELVDRVDPFVPAYKVGSGDITWPAIIRHMARKGKPVLIAAGASTMDDVQRAVATALAETPNVGLMQCNTNYTGSLENLRHVHLRVLETFRAMYPDMVLGLSDHTPRHATVLGAVALGAKVIEKHFTDDMTREGPDHGFSMDPTSWREMVERTRELEAALGSPVKDVADNERETVVVQRRAIRAARPIPTGKVVQDDDVEVLRPCPPDGIPPYLIQRVVGATAHRDIAPGEHLRWTDLV